MHPSLDSRTRNASIRVGGEGTGGSHIVLIATALALMLPLLASPASDPVTHPSVPAPIRPLPAPDSVPMSGVVTAGPPPVILAAGTDIGTIPFGTQYRVTNTPGAQNEVSIAVNPTNPLNIIATANDYRGGDAWCGVYATRDGGRTWLEQLLPRGGSLTFLEVSGDPSVAFDADGNAYQACLGFNRSANPGNVITVSKSTNGGLTWSTPVTIAGTTAGVFHDKPYIVTDRSTAATRGNVYLTWTRYVTGASPIYFSRSTDGGLSWSTGIDITTFGYKADQGSQPAVGPGGELYVSFWATGSRIALAKSTDGGTTWGVTRTVAIMFDPGELYPSPGPRTPHFPSLAVNSLDAPGGNRVHLVWADRRFGDADILMSTSEDGGGTWGAPVRVNDDTPGKAQFFPFVTASEKGLVHVSFYDRRADPADLLLTVYVATSTDFGPTFGNRRASAQFGAGTWVIGDYLGIASHRGLAYAAWCDLPNGGGGGGCIGGAGVSPPPPPPPTPFPRRER